MVPRQLSPVAKGLPYCGTGFAGRGAAGAVAGVAAGAAEAGSATVRSAGPCATAGMLRNRASVTDAAVRMVLPCEYIASPRCLYNLGEIHEWCHQFDRGTGIPFSYFCSSFKCCLPAFPARCFPFRRPRGRCRTIYYVTNLETPPNPAPPPELLW